MIEQIYLCHMGVIIITFGIYHSFIAPEEENTSPIDIKFALNSDHFPEYSHGSFTSGKRYSAEFFSINSFFNDG